MKYTTHTLITLSVASLLAVSGCGSSSTEDDPINITPISDDAQARDVSASGNESANLMANSSNLLLTGADAGFSTINPTSSSIPLPAIKTFGGSTTEKFDSIAALRNPTVVTTGKKVLSQSITSAKSLSLISPSVAVDISVTGQVCNDGGNYDVSGSYDDIALTYSFSVTFNSCRDGGNQLNGTVAYTGAFNVATATFNGTAIAGDGDGALEDLEDLVATRYEDNTYATEVANLVEDLSYSYSLSNTSSNVNIESASFAANANGGIRYTDVLATESATVTYASLQLNGTHARDNGGTPGELPADVVDDVEDNSITANGGVSLDAVLIDASINYTGFRLTQHETYDYDDYTIDGTVAINFTPDTCTEGTYSFVTNVPVRENNFGTTIAGEMVINGNVTIVFNADGTVTVTVGTNPPVTYSSWSDLQNRPSACPILQL
jgi:hypothetical protein